MKEELLKMYSPELKSIDQVSNVFVNFLTKEPNEAGVKVTRLPWSEQESDTSTETQLIKEQLIWCNANNIFTINSQPSVNGAPSTDPIVGWGTPGGYCYQKAYLEFFIDSKRATKLKEVLNDYPLVNYHIINQKVSSRTSFFMRMISSLGNN